MELIDRSLTEQINEVSAGRLTVREVVAAHLARCHARQAELNAFTLIDDERALLRAEQADRRRAAGERPGPLSGAALAVKDLIDQQGLPTTCGSSFYREVARSTAPVIARLEGAGAVVIGRTGLHEFAFGFSSENPWWGPVRNPWDPSTSAGGSSGGSAVAVAAGLAGGALGTDTGGSVRVPAALCGVVGLKVTHGRVPLDGVFPLAPGLDTVGPLARTVGDAAVLYRALVPDDRDPAGAAPAGHPTGLRIGIPVPWIRHPVDPAVGAAFGIACERLVEAGAIVEEIDAPLLEPPGMIAAALAGEVTTVHRRWYPARAGEYGADVAGRLASAFDTPVAETLAAREWQARLRHEIAGAFDRVDVLITPATAVTRKSIGVDQVEVEGHSIHYRTALSQFTALVNHTGCPALVVPLAAPGSPPPALQIIGPHRSERRLLSIGLGLEAAGIVSHPSPPVRENRTAT